MIRKTSIETYHRIKDEGLLSKRRFDVYKFIFENGPCTAKQILMAKLPQGCASGTYSGRFSELRDLGVIEELGTTICEFTGNSVILWDVTGKTPSGKILKRKIKPTRAELEKRIRRAEDFFNFANNIFKNDVRWNRLREGFADGLR